MRGSGNHVDIVKRFESEKEAALGILFNFLILSVFFVLNCISNLSRLSYIYLLLIYNSKDRLYPLFMCFSLVT